MSRFREELRVIPVVAWLIAIVVAVCMEFLLLRFAFPDDPNVRNWPFLAQAGLSTFAALIVAAYILLVGYIWARRQTPRHAPGAMDVDCHLCSQCHWDHSLLIHAGAGHGNLPSLRYGSEANLRLLLPVWN